jgi:dipeptidyl-peptidase-4
MGAMAGKKLDLKEMTSGALRGESMSAVRPLADGETYAQLSDDGKRVVRYSYKTVRAAGTLFDVAAVGEPHLEQLDGYLLSQDGRRMLIQTATKRIYRHSSTAEYYVYDLGGQHLTHLSEGGAQQTPLFSPDGRQVAFVRDNNIFLTGDGEEVQVTRDGKKNEVINGIPDWVNEEEFGHSRAMVFTADGRYLVWVRYDESAVKEYSMPTFRYKYPFAGDQNSSVSVWCYDITTRQTRRVAVPLDNDGYIPRLVMTPDAGQVAVYTLNRHQDHLCIYMADMTTADCRLTIEERINKYVREEVLDGIHIGKRHILLPSDRDGYMHLYLYDRSGQLLRQVESGDYEVSAVYGMDEKSGDVYYASHEWGATDQQVWVARKDGRRECLTAQKGWNTAIFSKNFKYFIKTWSDLNTPAVYALCDNKGRTLTTLIDNHALRESWAAYEQGERSLFTLTTSEGVTLNGWLIKPADFDATKQYPVVMYQYGGPGNQQVKNAWGIGMMGQGALLEQYLCQLGFVCVCIDGRGTGGRSADFEKSTYLKLGFQEARDQVESALWLARQPWVDGQRIGIWGWSFGGFNTLMSMSEGRDVFCCGIAIAPPTSWRYYDTIYTERYMRTPQENAEGYDDNPISRAEKLHGALLLCHGSGDDNVHFRNTEEYTDALVKADKDFRQLVYTNRNHSIYGGNTRNHLFRQCVNFFLEKMK